MEVYIDNATQKGVVKVNRVKLEEDDYIIDRKNGVITIASHILRGGGEEEK